MSELRSALNDYLATRRALGFKLEDAARLLSNFVDHVEEAGATTVTTELALAWATRPQGTHPSWWAARLGAVRGFAKYLAAVDPTTEVPPVDLLPHRSRRAVPYLYSPDEIAALMAAARRLRSPLRAATYETLIGLLAATGMRVGEAIGLARPDVDLGSETLVVRAGKFNKSREVLVHESTVAALKAYAGIRDRLCPLPAAPNFLVSTAGTRLIYKNVQFVFSQLTREVGLVPRSPRCRPRIHDLRHRFAVETLRRWHEAGLDVEAHLPALSTYLGHTNPSSTYWYLTATPELLATAAERLEVHTGGQR